MKSILIKISLSVCLVMTCSVSFGQTEYQMIPPNRSTLPFNLGFHKDLPFGLKFSDEIKTYREENPNAFSSGSWGAMGSYAVLNKTKYNLQIGMELGQFNLFIADYIRSVPTDYQQTNTSESKLYLSNRDMQFTNYVDVRTKYARSVIYAEFDYVLKSNNKYRQSIGLSLGTGGMFSVRSSFNDSVLSEFNEFNTQKDWYTFYDFSNPVATQNLNNSTFANPNVKNAGVPNALSTFQVKLHYDFSLLLHNFFDVKFRVNYGYDHIGGGDAFQSYHHFGLSTIFSGGVRYSKP